MLLELWKNICTHKKWTNTVIGMNPKWYGMICNFYYQLNCLLLLWFSAWLATSNLQRQTPQLRTSDWASALVKLPVAGLQGETMIQRIHCMEPDGPSIRKNLAFHGMAIFSPSCEDFPEIKGGSFPQLIFGDPGRVRLLEFDQINGWLSIGWWTDSLPWKMGVSIHHQTSIPFESLLVWSWARCYWSRTHISDRFVRLGMGSGKWYGKMVGFSSVFRGPWNFPLKVGGGRSGPVGTNCTSPATMSPLTREAFLGSSRGKCNLAAVKQMSKKNAHCNKIFME